MCNEKPTIFLPPLKGRVRMGLMSLAAYKDIPTESLLEMAHQLPGGKKVHLPDRSTMIAFLLGTRQIDMN